MNNIFKRNQGFIVILLIIFLLPVISISQEKGIKKSPFTFWSGTNPKMTIKQLASYCAPIFWFSPDEPELENKKGKDIRIPAPFPFEPDSGRPVVYYQIRNIITKENSRGMSYIKDYSDINNSILDLSKINGLDIDYSDYYKNETGLGRHRHDTEQSQFKIYIRYRRTSDTSGVYDLILLQVTAKAHALAWFDNIYQLDTTSFELKLPFHILVEEGKHASCTDINGDGYYTPGYDVNVRTNDAWGVRDIMRTGSLFTAEFQSYMAKVRPPEYRVFPPLPEDSPKRETYVVNGVYAPENAVYELRPMPPPKKAEPDKLLEHDMSGYSMKNWPVIREETNVGKLFKWWEGDLLIKSIAVNFRYDKYAGFSITVPFLIVKNVETPIIGGWMVNRFYMQNMKLPDFGYNLIITPSASRFMDPYFAAGVEVWKNKLNDSGATETKTDFVLETGLKFRANVNYSPLKFLSIFTDFWGVRIGIKNKGFVAIDHMNYVFELGAGCW